MTGRKPDPMRVCRRCERPRCEHDVGRCPDGEGYLSVTYQAPDRASASFAGDELDLLEQVLRLLRRGGDPRQIARSNPRPLQALARTVITMRRGIQHRTRKDVSSGEIENDKRRGEDDRAAAAGETGFS